MPWQVVSCTIPGKTMSDLVAFVASLDTDLVRQSTGTAVWSRSMQLRSLVLTCSGQS